MADILPPAPVDAPFGSYNWVNWYQQVRTAINQASVVPWSHLIGIPSVSTTAPLTGGGNLAGSLTLGVSQFTSGTSGIVPASGGGTSNFLRADGNWAAAGDPWTYVKLSSDFVTGSSTPVNVTGFGFTPAANTEYVVEGFLMVQTSSTSYGAQPGITWPTGLNNGSARIDVTQTTSSFASIALPYTTNGSVVSTGLPLANTSYPSNISATFITGASPTGNFQITLEI